MAGKKEQSKEDEVLATANSARRLLKDSYFLSILKRMEDGANEKIVNLQVHNVEEFKVLTQSKAFLRVLREEIAKDERQGRILEEKLAGSTKKPRITK